MYFIGQTRFSLYIPNCVDWNISNFEEDRYVEHLFSDERMTLRAKIFSEISIPLMNKMKGDFEFYHIISYSSILPKKWKDLLFKLAEKYPFIYLHEIDKNKDIPIPELLKNKKEGSVAFFRLDDDDLLSIDYLNNLSKYNSVAFKNMAISFGKGIIGFYKGKDYIDFRDAIQKYPSMGQAYIGYWKNNILELPPLYSHHNLDQNIPVIVDSLKIMYLQTYHAIQDTHYRFSDNATGISIEAELAKFPKSKSYDDLLYSFPILEKSVSNFIDRKKSLYAKKNIKLDKQIITFPVKLEKEKELFEVEYNISLPKNFTSPKALLISFSFSEKIGNIHGLTLSDSSSIGWYKYLSSINGVSSGTFSFLIDKPMKINELKIMIWDNRFKSVDINSLEIL